MKTTVNKKGRLSFGAACLASIGFFLSLGSLGKEAIPLLAEEPSYVIGVITGDSDPRYSSYRKKAGDTLALTAPAKLEDGSTFYKWSADSSSGISFANENSRETTASIGSANGYVTAEYCHYFNELNMYITPPKGGHTPDYYPEIDFWNELGDYGDLYWYRGTDMTAANLMNDEDTFVTNGQYTLLVYVKPTNPGYMAWDPIKEKKVYINDQEAVATGQSNGDGFAFKKTFLATGEKSHITIETSNGVTTKEYSQGEKIVLNTAAKKENGDVFSYWNVKYGDVDMTDSEDANATVTVLDKDTYIEAAYTTPIDSIDLKIEAPAKGRNPEYKFSESDSLAYVAEFYGFPEWCEVSFDATSKKYNEVKVLSSDDTFEQGRMYRYTWTMRDNWDYDFVGERKIMVNGQDVTSTMSNPVGGPYFTYYAIFTATDVRNRILIDGGVAEVDGVLIEEAEAGASVTIKADPQEGKKFIKWEVLSGGVSLKDANNPTTSFTMSEQEVSIRAVYKTLIDKVEMSVVTPENGKTPDFESLQIIGDAFALVMNGIVWYEGDKVSSSMMMGEEDTFETGKKYTVSVKVDAVDGYIFALYSDLSACRISGVDATVIDGDGTESVIFLATFTAVDKTPTALISVSGGRFEDGSVSGEFKIGSIVTVYADKAEVGYEFAGWVNEKGEIVSKTPTYSFEVTGPTTLTSSYEKTVPIPVPEPFIPEPSGLSGGAIAGIVIGCVLAASIGGGAIVWFGVKKKSWNDLVAAIKGVFKKK